MSGKRPRQPADPPPAGTGGVNPHYQRIWDVVRSIPAGRVSSYGQVAERAGLARRARLAGRALSCCPDDLPWHRVVNAQGRIVFARGSAQFESQKRRLEEEGVHVSNGRVDLARHGLSRSLDELLWRPDGWRSGPKRRDSD